MHGAEPETRFHKGNIISWTHDKDDKDVALSFKDAQGADEAWKMIQMILNKDEDRTEKYYEAEEMLDKPALDSLMKINNKIANCMFLLSKRAKMVQQLLKDDVFLFWLFAKNAHTRENT